MRLVSYHKTKAAAERFAKDLRLQGAKGVRVGRKGREGYPVYSTLGGKL